MRQERHFGSYIRTENRPYVSLPVLPMAVAQYQMSLGADSDKA
jgi:hypothetical protein